MSEGTLAISRCMSNGMWEAVTDKEKDYVFDRLVAEMAETIKNTPNWKNADEIVMIVKKIQSPPGLGPSGATNPDTEARMKMWRESGPK
jgi:hypothetical protein